MKYQVSCRAKTWLSLHVKITCHLHAPTIAITTQQIAPFTTKELLN